jgi:O-acetyl-ADP-ribose deacetylase (regulator of RNase III)
MERHGFVRQRTETPKLFDHSRQPYRLAKFSSVVRANCPCIGAACYRVSRAETEKETTILRLFTSKQKEPPQAAFSVHKTPEIQ